MRFSRFDIGFGDQYALGTKHDESHSPNPEQMGFKILVGDVSKHSYFNYY